jgi:hypothetical protein
MDQLAVRLRQAERHPSLNEGRMVAHSHLENTGSPQEREEYIRALGQAADRRPRAR